MNNISLTEMSGILIFDSLYQPVIHNAETGLRMHWFKEQPRVAEVATIFMEDRIRDVILWKYIFMR